MTICPRCQEVSSSETIAHRPAAGAACPGMRGLWGPNGTDLESQKSRLEVRTRLSPGSGSHERTRLGNDRFWTVGVRMAVERPVNYLLKERPARPCWSSKPSWIPVVWGPLSSQVAGPLEWHWSRRKSTECVRPQRAGFNRARNRGLGSRNPPPIIGLRSLQACNGVRQFCTAIPASRCKLAQGSQKTPRWRKGDSNLYGAFPVKWLFWVLLRVLCSEVCPGKASMFSRRQSCRGKSQSP